MSRKLIWGIAIIGLIYCLSYVVARQMRQEIWEKDGKNYVIFPDDKILYYLYRPLSVMDEKLTGINSHIGQHK